MKLTKTQLKRIIKEELGSLLQEEKGTWILVKKSRHVENPTSDSGYKGKTYASKEEAKKEADRLTKGNPVGFDVVKVKDEELNEGWEQALTSSGPGVLFAKMREMHEEVLQLLLSMEGAGIEEEILEPVGRAASGLADALKITGGI